MTFRPLKRFGQNFLIDKNITAKIIEAVGVSRKDFCLEIGPGQGALTLELARRAKRLLAVELDFRLVETLAKQTAIFKNAQILSYDILKFDLKSYVSKHRIKKFKVIGNLPFYITTPILEYLFKNMAYIDDIFVTVQKEVAGRMTARPGSSAYGSLSCFAAYYCEPRVLFKIKSGSFWPAPGVEAAFMRLRPFKKNERGFKLKSESLFFRLMRAAFNQRRKRLKTSLSELIDKTSLSQLSCQDLLNRRPEELSIQKFAFLSDTIFDFISQR
jgi:16S rRNA (adenine1518-N6/adenine1519-N6)-dimethyltransferase